MTATAWLIYLSVPGIPLNYKEAKPYTRWWWFSNEIRKSDIAAQLDWIKKNNFGGVEIAWVYPQPDQPRGAKWLSDEWSDLVVFTKDYCDRIGLGCDFTFGTLWPFGGSMVKLEDAAQTYSGPITQRLDRSWEEPKQGFILNHLDRRCLARYAEVMGHALEPAMAGSPSGLFCDSWEIPGTPLWTEGFDRQFLEGYGYDIKPYMNDLDRHPEIRYDYRKLLSEYVIREFYAPFTEICHSLSGFSRVQCHGAPTDLVAAYAAIDAPETEAILFDPEFSVIPASAAALSGKTITSAEAFTCLYGWIPYPGPAPHRKQEYLADLKLLADALFASGTNLVVWHGMPFNPAGGTNEFYASVHVGPDSAFAPRLPEFNAYLQKVSALLQAGETESRAAVYLPLEDAWMQNELPEHLRKPSAQYFWEMHHARIPEEIKGYRPLWITRPFLARSRVEHGELAYGERRFHFLWLDCQWLDHESLREILRLNRDGLAVVVKRRPRCPGHNIPPEYDRCLDELMARSSDIPKTVKPLAEGSDMPDFWCRRDGDTRYFFFGHPRSRNLTYPMLYGQSFTEQNEERTVLIDCGGAQAAVPLVFLPYQSLALRCQHGKAEFIDIEFTPPSPRP